MIQEEKDLLLRDLCARLPYGVKTGRQNCFNADKIVVEVLSEILDSYEGLNTMIEKLNLRPFLRPMSSMTDEEKEEYDMLQTYPGFKTNHTDLTDMYDWLNKNMFDYRGLIPMGLALEAPKGMYKQ